LRTLFARKHATIYPGKGVFLAGPTPPDGNMANSWRRRVICGLNKKFESDDDVIVVSPEPENGNWTSILSTSGKPSEVAENDQIAWELQYLELCDVTAFWLPVYWNDEKSEDFPANIGPTTRWEYGMMLQKFLGEPRRKLILGAPEDAESIGWVRHTAKHYNLDIHWLPRKEKSSLVAEPFIDAIVSAIQNPI